ncbi:MAG: DoxX family protein [Pseudomonadota bacterium]
MKKLTDVWGQVTSGCNSAGEWVGLLIIRLLMAYEFANAGFRKLNSSETLWGDVPGWFARNMANAPFPFAQLPAELNWFLVTWAEILGGLALVIGLFTRFWAFSLLIVTIVAIFSTHWPAEWSSLGELWEGYRVTARDGSGNFRIPLLFLAMLIPLVLIGPGRLSVDHLIATYVIKK